MTGNGLSKIESRRRQSATARAPLCSNENERTANAATAKHTNVCVEHHTTIAVRDGGSVLYMDEVKAYSFANKIVRKQMCRCYFL